VRRSTGLIADQYVLPRAAREDYNAVIALVRLLRQTCRDCMSRRGGEESKGCRSEPKKSLGFSCRLYSCHLPSACAELQFNAFHSTGRLRVAEGDECCATKTHSTGINAGPVTAPILFGPESTDSSSGGRTLSLAE
jgi:hypothetical protein